MRLSTPPDIDTRVLQPAKPAATAGLGRVVAVHGSVIDIAFPEGALPAINEAVAIEWDLGPAIATEVQLHLDPARVRVVALAATAGLRRGTPARATP